MSDTTNIRDGFRDLKDFLVKKEDGEDISFETIWSVVKQIETAVARLVFFSNDNMHSLNETKFDLTCDDCGSQVKDQRALKADPQETYYDSSKPDFKCTNYNNCSGGFEGKSGWISKGWWLNAKSGHPIPKHWDLFK